MSKFLTQNRKIAVAVMIVFVVSFSVMTFFLSKNGGVTEHGKASVAHSTSGETSGKGSALSEVEVKYRELLDEDESPVFATDPSGKFTFLSKSFCDMLRINDCVTLEGKLFYDYVNADDLSQIISVHTDLLNKGKKVDGSGPYRIKSGDVEKMVMLDIVPVLDKEENLETAVFAAHDITKQVKELNDSTKAVNQIIEKNEKNADEDSNSKEAKEPSEWLQDLYSRGKELKFRNMGEDSKMAMK